MNKLALFFIAAALALPGVASANLITNGGFEDKTNFVPDGNNTMSLFAGSTAMTGWTVTGDSLAWIGTPNPFGLSAHGGDFFLDLTDYPVNAPFGGVSQTISTVAGQTYSMTFYLGSSSNYGLPSAVNVTAGDANQTFTSTLTGSDNWEVETLSFKALGGSTLVTLQGVTGYAYIGLDDISIDGVGGVPEPAAWALMLAGFGMIGATLRRRRVAVA